MLRYAATSDWGSRPRYFSVRTSVAITPPPANIPKGFRRAAWREPRGGELEKADEAPELERGEAERHHEEQDGFHVQPRLRLQLSRAHDHSESRPHAIDGSYER